MTFIRDDPHDWSGSRTVYVLDEEQLGRGDDGFTRLLARLESFPPGSTLVDTTPARRIDIGSESAATPAPGGRPYKERLEELTATIRRLGLSYEYHGGAGITVYPKDWPRNHR